MIMAPLAVAGHSWPTRRSTCPSTRCAKYPISSARPRRRTWSAPWTAGRTPGRASIGAGGREDGAPMRELFGGIFERIAAASRSAAPERGGGDAPSAATLRAPFEVVVVEHTPSSVRSDVNTFERNALSRCQLRRQQQTRREQRQSPNEVPPPCDCYVAQLTLVNDAVQHLEKPRRRELECWSLAAPAERHATTVRMARNGVIVKRGEVLSDWRGRISDIQESNNGHETGASTLHYELSKLQLERKKKYGWAGGEKKLKASKKRCLVVTFRGIRPPPVPAVTPEAEEKMKLDVPRERTPALPLAELLTVVVTTSPIRSHPSTDMLQHTFGTFPLAGEEFAYACPKVIVCDGCRVFDPNDPSENPDDETVAVKTTRKYSNVKQTLRNG